MSRVDDMLVIDSDGDVITEADGVLIGNVSIHAGVATFMSGDRRLLIVDELEELAKKMREMEKNESLRHSGR